MTTRITNKPKRCLKFEGWIYLPAETSNLIDTLKELKYYSGRTTGRLQIFNETGRKMGSKSIAFDSMGEMVAEIEKVRKKMVMNRTKKTIKTNKISGGAGATE